MVAVAAMTQAGFAGNLRYVALPAALVCVLAGAGWVGLVRAPTRRFGARRRDRARRACSPRAVAPVRASPTSHELDHDQRAIGAEADLYGTVPERDRRRRRRGEAASRCGTVYTGAFQTQAVAWYMHLHEMAGRDLRLPARHDDRARATRALSRDPRFPPIARTRKWVIGVAAVPRG